MARFRGKENLDKAETFTHEDLTACAEAQGVKIEKRDILVIRTNFLKLFFDQGEKFYEGFCEPGLVYSPELVQWFQDMEIPNLVTDTIANEVTTDPNNGVALPLHNALMRNLGVTLTEICDLEKLAADCAEDGQYTFLYAAAPLKVNQAQRLAGQPPGDQVTTYDRTTVVGPLRPGNADRHYAGYPTCSTCSTRRWRGRPDSAAIKYFDGVLTMSDLDAPFGRARGGPGRQRVRPPGTGSRSTCRTSRSS